MNNDYADMEQELKEAYDQGWADARDYMWDMAKEYYLGQLRIEIGILENERGIPLHVFGVNDPNQSKLG